MEVAVIDWKNIDSRFVKDDMYELINAPKWVDFSAPDDPVDDEAWFCRPSCNHPKTVEDFFKEREKTPTSNSKKLYRSANVSEILPFGERNRRDATLKKRGTNPPVLLNKDTHYDGILEDSENQNPNFSTLPKHKSKLKEALKTSTEKKQVDDTVMRKGQTPRLKSTLSARNLLPGGDLLNKVAEFCNELKKLATKMRDRDDVDNVNGGEVEKQSKDYWDDDSGDFNDKEKEKKPLLELNKDKMKVMETSNSKEKQMKIKRNVDAENTPITVDVKNIKHKEEGSLQIQTSPPTPQCFSANRGTSKTVTPKSFRSRPQGRGILQELQETNKAAKMVEHEQKINHGREIPVTTAEKEARTLNAFWFLKPCTLSS